MTKLINSAYIFPLAIVWMVYPSGTTDSVLLDDLACGQVYNLSRGHSIDVQWNGTDLSYNCSLGFVSRNKFWDTCIKIKQFLIYECVFEIQIQDANKTYYCNTTVIGEEYCISSHQTVYLDFIYSYTGTITSSQEVRVRVEVGKKKNSEEGGFNPIFLSIGVVVIFLIFCGQSNRKGRNKHQNNQPRSVTQPPASSNNVSATNDAHHTPREDSTNSSSPPPVARSDTTDLVSLPSNDNITDHISLPEINVEDVLDHRETPFLPVAILDNTRAHSARTSRSHSRPSLPSPISWLDVRADTSLPPPDYSLQVTCHPDDVSSANDVTPYITTSSPGNTAPPLYDVPPPSYEEVMSWGAARYKY